MPLVVPGLMSKEGGAQDLTTQWTNKLAGKKIGDASDETVGSYNVSLTHHC